MSAENKVKHKLNLHGKRVNSIYHFMLWFVGLSGMVVFGCNYMIFIRMYSAFEDEHPCQPDDQVCIEGQEGNWLAILGTVYFFAIVIALFLFWTLRGPKPETEVKA